MSRSRITNVRAVLPNRVAEGCTVEVVDGRIASIAEAPLTGSARAAALDAGGATLLPGFIDTHNDGIEQEIEPRPGAVFPLEVALRSVEARLVSHGITTIFHSFSFMDGREGSLAPESIEPAIQRIDSLRAAGIIRHLVHARYEMVEVHHVERLVRLIDAGHVNLISFMDHTPGQGQYRDPKYLVRYYMRKYDTPPSEVEALIRERLAKARAVDSGPALEHLARHARSAGLPMASHDDDTPQKVRRMHALGVTISEFPVTFDAALAASESRMRVAVGAPNALRGASTGGNLSAREAIESGVADLLCSDYYTPSMLHAVFRLSREGLLSLPHAVRLASANPAAAVGVEADLGTLEVGKRADMILVSEAGDVPSVLCAWVGGTAVYQRHDGGAEERGRLLAREAAGRVGEEIHAS